ncbi:hypothetical protein [Hydrogenophaga palleronii]|uniref:hypothetical protein n=1 Tax=Hydrogenophaga palleronii TaxID=65655 RepID=UPI000824EE15|nr:hypothetical protein [Hydrogenophaga palleronii]
MPKSHADAKAAKPSASREPQSPASLVSRTPRSPGTGPATSQDEHLELPHERDQSHKVTAVEPDAMIQQAHEDLRKGLVDTDMRATPGLDAEQRRRHVPGPGGQGPAVPRKR